MNHINEIHCTVYTLKYFQLVSEICSILLFQDADSSLEFPQNCLLIMYQDANSRKFVIRFLLPHFHKMFQDLQSEVYWFVFVFNSFFLIVLCLHDIYNFLYQDVNWAHPSGRSTVVVLPDDMFDNSCTMIAHSWTRHPITLHLVAELGLSPGPIPRTERWMSPLARSLWRAIGKCISWVVQYSVKTIACL